MVRDIISGTGGIANTAFTKASGGMNIQSSSLISRDIADAQYETPPDQRHRSVGEFQNILHLKKFPLYCIAPV